MNKLKKDPIREERIQNQVMVDTYGPEESAMGWYYLPGKPAAVSLRGQMHRCQDRSPLCKGETVHVLGLAPEDACSADILVMIRWQGRKMAVPLSQLTALNVDQSSAQAIGDWHYWLAQSYSF
jgi:hypothetical protein